MADPQNEMQGTTHTYVARVWYRDTATLFLIGSFVWFAVQDQTFLELVVPHRYHELIAKGVLMVALWIRFQSSTRPVAMREGATREVHSIAPKGADSVSSGTRSRLTGGA